jgi:hypothetical protein
MKATTVGRLISEELAHIPRSHKGSTQNVFRMLYTYHRRRDLAEDPAAPARNALHAAIRSVEAGHNAVSPTFEWEFFRPGGGSAQMMRDQIDNGATGERHRRRKEPAR